jgi:hypothetical protein
MTFGRANASSTFALESHLHFVREVKEGAPLRFEARLIDVDAKRLHYYQEMFHATEGYLAATYEVAVGACGHEYPAHLADAGNPRAVASTAARSRTARCPSPGRSGT